MTVVGFTASQHMSTKHHSFVDAELFKLSEAKAFITGGCINGDSYIARKLLEFFPPERGYRHIIVWPKDERTVDKVDLQLRGIEGFLHFDMPAGSDNKARNAMIVEKSHVLVAFPLHPAHKNRYSGTWQTIRLGTKKPLPVKICQLWDHQITIPSQ